MDLLRSKEISTGQDAPVEQEEGFWSKAFGSNDATKEAHAQGPIEVAPKPRWQDKYKGASEATAEAAGSVFDSLKSSLKENDATAAAHGTARREGEAAQEEYDKAQKLAAIKESLKQSGPVSTTKGPVTNKSLTDTAAKNITAQSGQAFTPKEKKNIQATIPSKASDANKWLFLVEGLVGLATYKERGRGAKVDMSALKEMRKANIETDKATALKAAADEKLAEAQRQFNAKYDQAERALQAKGGEGKGKRIGSADARSLGELDSADEIIDDLAADYKKNASAYGSGITSTMPWSVDPDKYEASRSQKAQILGGIMEGGKLSDQDYDRYYDMLPSPWHTDVQAANRISELRSLLKAKKRGALSGLRSSGYDTEGFDSRQEQQERPTKPKRRFE